MSVDLAPLLAATPAVIGAVIGFVGLLADALPLWARILIAVGAGCCALLAWLLHKRLQRKHAISELPLTAVEQEFEGLANIDGIGLSVHAVESLQRSIFAGATAGRLSIYGIDLAAHKPKAIRIARFSSDGFNQSGGREEFDVEDSFLRELRGTDTTALGGGHANSSGEAPDRDVDPEAWRSWQMEILHDPMVVAGLRMGSRRYSWFAIRDPRNQDRTLVLMAESADPMGIDKGKVDGNALSMLLPALVQQIEAGARVAERIEEVRARLRSVAMQ